MKLNADFEQSVVVPARDHDFVASPTPGVTRMMLDRVGDEVAPPRLSRCELTPFRECSSAVLLEDVAGVEVTV